MKDAFQRLLNLVLSLSLILTTPVGAIPNDVDGDDTQAAADLSQDSQRFYWSQLDQENPLLTEFALGEPVTQDGKLLWQVTGDNPLLDANPYFMRSQAWTKSAGSCPENYCANKSTDGSLTLQVSDGALALQLKEKMTPILETENLILLSADDQQIFRTKNPGENDPGEGVFFIAKDDLNKAMAFKAPVPIFFFPLPGAGWTGPNDNAFELGTSDQVVLYNKDGFGLPIDRSDLALMEKVERNNLILAQSWTILEGAVTSGLPLPKANATLGFGVFLSGQLPQAASSVGVLDSTKLFGQMASSLSPLPKANAHEADPTMHQLLQDDITARAEQLKDAEPKPSDEKRGFWKRWTAPLIMYGGTALAAIGMAPHIDWSSLITADMPQRIETVSGMLGAVLAASVTMKYSVHKALFDKKYPHTQDENWIEWLNKEHKGVLDELVHGLWFSMAIIPQGIRHILDFLKDRFFPNNSMVHKCWEATMGYAMRQSSRLAMNWKTFYLGSMVFGMADSVMVAVHLLIFTPWLIQHFGWDLGTGAATAAYASAEVLRNFLAYLQSGAHSYSADVKMIHLKSAQDEAKRQVAAQGLDPEAAKNEGVVAQLTETEMQKRFKMVGLPGQDEFLYDPITFIEGLAAKTGFSADGLTNLSDDDKAQIAKHNFTLSRRRWGLIKPALQRALQTAQDAQAKAPSPTGEQTIKLLQWALNNRNLPAAVAGLAWDTAGSAWGTEGMKQAMANEVEKLRASGKVPTRLGALAASVKGAIKYFSLDATKEARDINSVLYMMSTSGSPLDFKDMLPKSWTDKAGSRDAALLGAELFHRSFNAYLATDDNMIAPDSELEAAYGARANAVLARISQRDPSLLADPFTRQVRYWEMMSRLQMRDSERHDVINYTPKADSDVAKRQWQIARDNATARLAAHPVEFQVAEEWLGLAGLYEIKTGENVVPEDWANSYKYRFIVAQEFAKQVGLTVNDLDKSEFVDKVVLAASIKTEEVLKATSEKFYVDSLSPDDRKFYEAKIFTRNFIDSYVDLSVRSDEHLKASSVEYPGVGQALRRKLIGVPGGKYITKVVRSVEALFRNEETSYAPGFWAAMDRYVPVIPDMFHNWLRNLRTLPYILSMSYLTSYYIWQIHIPYPLWVLMVSTGFIGTALVEFNNRLMRNHDIKPMDDVPSKLTYSFLHSNLTNPEAMAIQAIAQPVTEGFNAGLDDCAKLLSKVSRP